MSERRSTLEFDVARSEWGTFLQQFSVDHRSWLTPVERCDALDSPQVLVRELPLVDVTVDDPCGVAGAIQVTLAAEGADDVRRVRIPDPIAVRLVEPPGRVPWIEIHQATGECTRVRFRDVPLPELLDGIAPGETQQPLTSA